MRPRPHLALRPPQRSAKASRVLTRGMVRPAYTKKRSTQGRLSSASMR